MTMTFTGQVARIFDAETFTAKDGRTIIKRRVLLQTVEQFPQRILITVRNDLATNFPRGVGDTVTAYLSFEVNSNQAQTAFFNDIRAWRID